VQSRITAKTMLSCIGTSRPPTPVSRLKRKGDCSDGLLANNLCEPSPISTEFGLPPLASTRFREQAIRTERGFRWPIRRQVCCLMIAKAHQVYAVRFLSEFA
jgi:hypothetical protein